RTLKSQLSNIKGLAHITGGGMIGNIPRVLPQGLAASINSKSWEILPIFKLIEKQGKIDHGEMFHIFNMGVGMVIFCSPGKVKEIIAAVPQAKIIGEVVKQQGDARVVIDGIGYRMDKL
ncbi:MAG TPA: AIR synthase-related protein, partial [Dehalococcoidales bacterium]|nr:AIR synthase-related protein [Dehalococcoidales bacterium]